MALNQTYYTRTLNQETYNNKKHYDSNIYVIFPNNNFCIRKGSTVPIFTCFIKQKGEQFGDAMPVKVDITVKYSIRIYDNADNIILNEDMTLIDSYLGEYNYVFKSLDFSIQGNFYGEVISLKEHIVPPIVNGRSAEGVSPPVIEFLESVIEKFKINVI